MRITFVLESRNLSGGIRVIGIYARLLAARGHRVCLVSRPRSVEPLRRRVKSFLKGDGWPGDPNRQYSHLDGIDRDGVEHRIIESRRPITDADVPDADVVVATWWETAEWVNNLSPSKGAKAYFVQDFGAHGAQPIEKLVETWKMPMHKLVISRFIRDLVREHCPGDPLSDVPNSVDLEQFHAAPRGKQQRPTIGMMYSRSPFKGADLCFAAYELARQEVPNLLLVGFGPHPSAADLKPPAGSEFRSHVPDNELRDIYARCDAWLFPPRKEGYGLPILEAMACRTPVIAVPSGAAPELVEQGGGMLVPHDDPASMAQAIKRVCSMSDREWRTMSDAAYRTASGFTWEDATTLFEAALKQAIERQPAGVAA